MQERRLRESAGRTCAKTVHQIEEGRSRQGMINFSSQFKMACQGERQYRAGRWRMRLGVELGDDEPGGSILRVLLMLIYVSSCQHRSIDPQGSTDR